MKTKTIVMTAKQLAERLNLPSPDHAYWLIFFLRRWGMARRVGFLPRKSKGRPTELWEVPAKIEILIEESEHV